MGGLTQGLFTLSPASPHYPTQGGPRGQTDPSWPNWPTFLVHSRAPILTSPHRYLEMGAGHTASHLLEEGLLDLHKLGGLDDIKNLFHLPQEHHLQRGKDTGQWFHLPCHMPDRPLEAELSQPPSGGVPSPIAYLLLGAGFRPVFEQPPDHLWEGRQKGVRPAGTDTCLFPPRYSHALSRWHPFPGTAPHSMPAGVGGRRLGSGEDRDGAPDACSLPVSTLIHQASPDSLGCPRHHAWCVGTQWWSHRANVQQTSPHKF